MGRYRTNSFNLRQNDGVNMPDFDNDEVTAKDIEMHRSEQMIDIVNRVIDGNVIYNDIEKFNRLLKYFHKPFYKVRKAKTLRDLIIKWCECVGTECDLNWIDVSEMRSFFIKEIKNDYPSSMGIFYESKFNGDISKWDVSHVKNMRGAFAGAKFNGDISNWDVSNVTTMQDMFVCSNFNGDISKWDVSNVENMENMFSDSYFIDSDISNWNVSKVTDMAFMFEKTQFNGDISKWDVSNVTDMKMMFYNNNQFDQNISNWKIKNTAQTHGMFDACPIRKVFKPKALQNVSESVSNFNLRKDRSNVEFDDDDMNKEAIYRSHRLKRLHFNKDHFSEISEYFENSKLTLDDNGCLSTRHTVDLYKDCPFIDEDGHLMIQFGTVGGSFCCPQNGDLKLTSLEGCPEYVGGSFNCSNAELTTLEYSPISVGRYYYCGTNDPEEVNANCRLENKDYIVTEQRIQQILNSLNEKS